MVPATAGVMDARWAVASAVESVASSASVMGEESAEETKMAKASAEVWAVRWAQDSSSAAA
jgi:hypothetical protein